MKIGELVRDGDFKAEKHVPTIEAPEKAKAGESVTVKVSVGAEIKHPNTPLHHISWIQLFFKPEGAAPVIEIAKFNYVAHDDTMKLEVPGCAAADPVSCASVKLSKSGTFIALSYCNLHGLWQSEKKITVEA